MLTSAEVITSSDISDLLQLYGNDIYTCTSFFG